MMREYDTIMCLLNWPKELEDSQGDSELEVAAGNSDLNRMM
jgi:hypothetical protein